jgi:hypothetical protein
MALSLRIPAEKEELLRKAAAKTGKTKTAFILEALDEKLGLRENREKKVRELAGWMSREEALELRNSINEFNKIEEGDWD